MSVLTAAQLNRLRRMTGESQKPDAQRALDDATLDLIASESALMIDEDGNAPLDSGYVAVVDLYRAAAEAWRLKAGIVAEQFDFQTEGARFNRSQAYKHYLQMAARYASMAAQLSAPVGHPYSPDTDEATIALGG